MSRKLKIVSEFSQCASERVEKTDDVVPPPHTSARSVSGGTGEHGKVTKLTKLTHPPAPNFYTL
jgi:hypothetical protein